MEIYIYIYLTFCKTNNFNINSTDSSLFAFVIKKKVIKDVTICTRSQKVVLWHDLSRNQYHIVILPGLKAQCVSPAKHIQHNCIEISYFFFSPEPSRKHQSVRKDVTSCSFVDVASFLYALGGLLAHLATRPCLDKRWRWWGVAGCSRVADSCGSGRPGCPGDNGGDGYQGNGWGEH